MIAGYVFWFIISKITTADVVGAASTLVSIATIFSVVAALGVPTGVQRFLSKSFSEQKTQETSIFIKGSFVLVSLGIIVCSITILIAKDFFHNIFKIDYNLMLVFILMMSSLATFNLFRSIIISSLQTKILPVISLISVVTKIVLGIILVLVGMRILGVIIGFTSFTILGSVLLLIMLRSHLKTHNNGTDTKLKKSVKDTLSASLANWFPALVTTIGSQLGTIMIFGSKGASSAGIYFIGFSIFSAIFAIASVLLSIAYPALSAMVDGRKRFTWRITKMSLIITIPISSGLIYYSHEIMQLFGQTYINGTLSLQILLLSALPAIITSGVNALVYSKGNYRQVLVIGFASSIPRTALYFILVPFYGSEGAAISYTAGSIIGLAVSILFARKIGLHILWKDLFLILVIPMGLGFVLKYVEINYVAGIILTCIVPCILFLKIGIINRTDVNDSVGILPPKIANPTLKIINSIGKKLNGKY